MSKYYLLYSGEITKDYHDDYFDYEHDVIAERQTKEELVELAKNFPKYYCLKDGTIVASEDYNWYQYRSEPNEEGNSIDELIYAKYIRTKEGIYSLETVRKYGLEHCAVRQSDNIEDLFDELIVIGVYGDKYIKNYSDNKNLTYKGRGTKGAIWTTKGLIYVAERNSEGEWELL